MFEYTDDAFHEDPSTGLFLASLENDICSGRHLGTLPNELVRAMFATLTQMVDLAVDVEGDVEL